MKILQVIDHLAIGGAEKVCLDQANILAAKGHEVTMLFILNEGPLVKLLDKRIQILYLRRTFKFDLLKMIKFSDLCNKFDIVHIHQRYVFRYAIVANFIRKIRKPIVFQDHFGHIDFDQRGDRLLQCTRIPYQYIGVSEKLCQWAKKQLGLPQDRIHLLPNIIVREDQLTTVTNRNKKLVVVANFRPVKNIEFALQLLKKMHEAGLMYQLDIYGSSSDGDYRQVIHQHIDTLQLGPYVQIIEGVSSIQPLLHQYDMALHTAKSETGPLVLIEYLAQCLPFLAYQTGEVAARLQNKFEHFFMSSFDLSAWMAKTRQILSQPRDAWKNQMDETFELYYGTDQYYRKCMQIYQSALRY